MLEKNNKDKKPDFALTLANHWSYIGIGWTMGIESCAQSLIDSFVVAQPEWGIKTCINLDAAAYEELNNSFPELIESLKAHIADGKVEVIGGTYSQPLGTMIGNESNVRQLVIGRAVLKKYLNEDICTFLEEEEFSYPQLPQLLISSGYKYASIAQCDTCGAAGIRKMSLNSFMWQAKDGTVIPCLPKNPLFLHPPVITSNIEYYQTQEGKAHIEMLNESGVSLAVVWTEFGWEPLGETQHHNDFDPERFKILKSKYDVEFSTIHEYMEKYARPENEIQLSMDDFDKLLPWGIGGDQLRVHDRKAEALLLCAERWEAFSSFLGIGGDSSVFEDIWKNLMTSQSHDVSLCEFYNWQRLNLFARNRLDNTHEILWGAIGYTYLDKAMTAANSILDESLNNIADKIDSFTNKKGNLAAIVYNSCFWERKKTIATTGKLCIKDTLSPNPIVVNLSGEAVPSQVIYYNKDKQTGITSVDIAFEVDTLPSCGYTTYYIQTNKQNDKHHSELIIDKDNLIIENKLISLRLDKTCGHITRFTDKKTGKNLLNGAKSGFGVFRGRADHEYCKRYGLEHVPEYINTLESEAKITWLEEGPLRASVCVLHTFEHVAFEMVITVSAHSPAIIADCRLRAIAPPAMYNRESASASLQEGYWLDFSTSFTPDNIYRDVPFGVEPTSKDSIHGFSFIDIVGAEQSLMLIHSGTQYFERIKDNAFSNLLMRNWTNVSSDTFGGWQSYCEYKYVLLPHDNTMTHQERLKQSVEMDFSPKTLVREPHEGSLEKEMCFMDIRGEGFMATSFRKKEQDKYEFRLYETEGNPAEAVVDFSKPVRDSYVTDLLGEKNAKTEKVGVSSIKVSIAPFKIITTEVELKV